jgi:E3 ubiquitin-protein ligase SIS3
MFTNSVNILITILAGAVMHGLRQHPIQCHKPLDFWFCMAGLQVVGFVLAFTVGRCAENGASFWFVDPHSWVAKASFTCTWTVLLPLLFGWTALGMSWLMDTLQHTPDCFPVDGFLTPTTCAFSQVLCGVGAAVYTVFVANVLDAKTCRRANAAAIRSVEDSDLVHRWGQLKPAASMELCGGLLSQEFADLPRHTMPRARADSGSECVICLTGLMEGDHARCLPGCSHVFHRACIDLWLLRQTSCPLCKTDVRCVKAGCAS